MPVPIVMGLAWLAFTLGIFQGKAAQRRDERAPRIVQQQRVEAKHDRR